MSTDVTLESWVDQGKKCSICGQWKPLSEFHRNCRSYDGYRTYCKQCHLAMNRRCRITAAPLEKSIVASILRYLNSLPGCYACKVHGGAYMAGWPDIIGCCRGRALALEVKRPGQKATPLQVAVLEKWRRAGAVAAVVTSRKEVEELLLRKLGGE